MMKCILVVSTRCSALCLVIKLSYSYWMICLEDVSLLENQIHYAWLICTLLALCFVVCIALQIKRLIDLAVLLTVEDDMAASLVYRIFHLI